MFSISSSAACSNEDGRFAFLKARTVLLLALATVLFGWVAFLHPMYIDQGVFAVCAERMLHGHTLYAEAWDVKTPGIFFMYALPLLAGDFQMPLLALFHLVLSWFSAVALFALGHQALGRGYAWTVSLLYLALAGAWGQPTSNGQPDNWLVPFFLWAIVFLIACWGPGRRCLLYSFLAGILMGWVALLRPTMGFAALTLPVLWVVVGYGRNAVSLRQGIKLFTAYVGGGLFISFLVFLELIATGGFQEFLYTQLDWNMAYAQTSMDWSDLSFSQIAGMFAFHWRLFFQGFDDLAWALPIGGAALLLRGLTGRAVSLRVVLAWGVGFVGAAFSLFVQLKFYNYHFWPVLPFLAMALALGLWSLIEALAALYRRGDNRRRFKPLAIFGFVVLAGLPFVLPTMPAQLLGRQYNAMKYLSGKESRNEFLERFGFFTLYRPVEDREAADFILEHTPEERPPRLYIWGFRPEIYFYCGTIGPSRFPYNIPLRTDWTPESWHEELADEIDPDNLDFIIVGREDAFPWLTGNSVQSTEYVPAFLSEAIQSDFFLALQTETLKVFARKTLFPDWQDRRIDYVPDWGVTPPSAD